MNFALAALPGVESQNLHVLRFEAIRYLLNFLLITSVYL